LVTSLCEDVYSLAGVQLRTIRERLTRRSEALVQAVGVIFKNLYEKQIAERDNFCTDLETCCAASNDFFRMSEKCEEIVQEIQAECNLSPEASSALEEQSSHLLSLYSNDAVYAAQKTHLYCFEPVEDAIGTEIFGPEWEQELTQNELALTVVRTLDDFMEDLETFLDEVMVQKCVEAQIQSSVVFYFKWLLQRASEHKSSSKPLFVDNELALERIRGDATVMREYFEGMSEQMPTLRRIIEREFKFLDAIIEIMAIAAGLSSSDIRDFVLLVQKRVNNFSLTKFAIGDLYHLVKPSDEFSVYEMIDEMEEQMNTLKPDEEKLKEALAGRSAVPGLRIDEMVADVIGSGKRSRPLKPAALDRANEMLKNWFGRSKVTPEQDVNTSGGSGEGEF
jgi:Exocyst complex component Sec6